MLLNTRIEWAHSVGSTRYGLLEVSYADKPVLGLLEEGRRTRPPPNVMLVFDVSGSMMKNMDALRAVSEATLDLLSDGSKFCALSFDSECKTIVEVCSLNDATKETARALIAEKLVNLRKATDISAALTEVHRIVKSCNEPFNILLLTDGCATKGVTGSAGLRDLVSTKLNNFDDFATVHCIGLRNQPTDEFNSGFLAGLAIDSDGAFHLIEDKKQVAECLGDTLSHYYLTVCDNLKVSGVNVLTRMPTKGFRVMMDKPLKIVFSMAHDTKLDMQVTGVELVIDETGQETIDAKIECYKVLALQCIESLTRDTVGGKRFRVEDLQKDLQRLVDQMRGLKNDRLEQIIGMAEQALVDQDLSESAEYQAFMTSMSLNRPSVGMGAMEEPSEATMEMRAQASLSSQDHM